MSNIAMIGTGYVGLVSGAVLSDFGNYVICVDIDGAKIEGLKKGIMPIYEPGLEELVRRNSQYGRIKFTTDLTQAVQCSDIIFIAVGTPEDEDGSADLNYVLDAARLIAGAMNGYKIIVDKSTVPVGTGKKVRQVMQAELDRRSVAYTFDIVSNPEFLREGSAVRDFSIPDRVVLGAENERAMEKMKEVYSVLYKLETPFVETNIETAEMIKYASNAFLAVKISYINEIANLCEKVGANVSQVAVAMGKDGRISPKFLHAGPGYGGSCFPKDTKALAFSGRESGTQMLVIEAAIAANEKQKLYMVDKMRSAMGDLSGKTLAILGVTFKPNTDDMREAPSLVILPQLVSEGAKLRVFDPQGEKQACWRFKDIWDEIYIAKDEYDAMTGADATVIITDWTFFRNLNFERAKAVMKDSFFFDLRNIYKREVVEKYGMHYYGVGV